MMHVNVRKLKQLHVKVGSMDFPGGGYKILWKFVQHINNANYRYLKAGRLLAILSKVNARSENTLALMYVCPATSVMKILWQI